MAATQATKRNANADFGPFDATQARQRLRLGSPKKGAGYQSRPTLRRSNKMANNFYTFSSVGGVVKPYRKEHPRQPKVSNGIYLFFKTGETLASASI
jgi:hypothetical protein